MSTDEKRDYLKLYLLQQAKINRLNLMMKENPLRRYKYKKMIKKSEALREKIEKAVDRVDGGILSEVLSQRYLCGRSLEQTAEVLNYSKRQIERMHTQAVDKLKVIK